MTGVHTRPFQHRVKDFQRILGQFRFRGFSFALSVAAIVDKNQRPFAEFFGVGDQAREFFGVATIIE